jgi:hypothetical protein
MIYVKQNVALIPQDVLDAAEQATRELEALPPDERKAFIDKKGDIWRAFRTALLEMSKQKCWYSESMPTYHHSRIDVDHFRPKGKAKRSETQEDEGYAWLAFDWKNFRMAAQLSNQLTTDPETEEVVGKGIWFPLADDSPKASWADRCEANEKPILLDPTVRADVDLIDVRDDGYMVKSSFCFGGNEHRVEESIKIYALNLKNLPEARKRVMREIERDVDELIAKLKIVTLSSELPVIDSVNVNSTLAKIREKTSSHSPYARAARAQLRYMGYADLGATPEDGAA